MTVEFGRRLEGYINGPESVKNQADLARRLGISRAQISRMVSGTQNARINDALAMVEELRVPQEEQNIFLLSAVGYPEDKIQEVTRSETRMSRNSVILLPDSAGQQSIRIDISISNE